MGTLREWINDPERLGAALFPVAEAAAMVVVGGAAGARSAPPKTAYSVAFETTIPKVGAGTRPAHFAAANEALLNAMRASPELSGMVEELGVQIPTNAAGVAKGLSPQGWTWHHVPNQPGVMQLVPRTQHTSGSPFYGLMHPTGHGGFFLWGSGY